MIAEPPHVDVPDVEALPVYVQELGRTVDALDRALQGARRAVAVRLAELNRPDPE
ncbi:hypothetical protein [Streptomyces pacificus]|uniref:Uncharacterized protein n=1 Tax=Streptomyces pacificus TaxID=2705029 RepID=A0A6A0AW85_9ACTN|nr:hypothetical protein [Streptomyces pacificus]GFH35847.1 hypothetical protein SCWH03_20690 [Streptomyces pacificus]